MIDISKAFDSVDHLTLLKSLKDCNLSNAALNLIFAYLSNRSQAVLDNDYNRTPFIKFTSGVPQGSSPAGLLFNLYINGILSILQSCKKSHLLFVDDFQIWLKCNLSHLRLTQLSIYLILNSVTLINGFWIMYLSQMP